MKTCDFHHSTNGFTEMYVCKRISHKTQTLTLLYNIRDIFDVN